MEQTTTPQYEVGERMNDRGEKIIHASALGLIVSVLVITTLVIGADLIPPLKAWLKSTFSHHWIGKGALGILAFFVAYVCAFIVPLAHRRAAVWLLVSLWVSIAGTFAITLFFLYEVFWH